MKNNWLGFLSCLPTKKSRNDVKRSNLSSDLVVDNDANRSNLSSDFVVDNDADRSNVLSSDPVADDNADRSNLTSDVVVCNDANWCDLSSDLIALIADRLTLNMADYVRFRAVCTAWRASTIHPRHRQHPPQLPWLIVNSIGNHLSVLSLSDGRKHRIKLPDIGGKYVSFACDGWLVLEDLFLLMVTLWNPITGEIVQLPTFLGLKNLKPGIVSYLFRLGDQSKRLQLRENKVSGMAISSSDLSSSDGCTFVVSFNASTVLAQCCAKDSSWTVFDKNYAYYQDVVFVKGTLYAVTRMGGVVVFSSAFEKVEHVEAPAITGSLSDCHKWQIVESAGKIIVLCRMKTRNPVIDVKQHSPVYDTENVHIFGIELKDNDHSLVKLNCLDGKMLFAGYCRPIVVPIDNYPLGKEDCVYFPDENLRRTSDDLICCAKSVVFNIRDGSTEELPYNRADTSVLGSNSWYTSKWHVPRFN